MDTTQRFIDSKFSKSPAVREANERALKAGWAFGETTELLDVSYQVEPPSWSLASIETSWANQALAWGLMAAAQLSGKTCFTEPIRLLQPATFGTSFAATRNFGVRTFQAEE